MDREKINRLVARGWKVGTVDEFLGLTPQESHYIELKLALHVALSESRKNAGLTQAELANRMGSSQSRVAKMEAGDSHVSVDLLLRGLFALGLSRADLARIIA